MRDRATLTIGACVASLLVAWPAYAQDAAALSDISDFGGASRATQAPLDGWEPVESADAWAATVKPVLTSPPRQVIVPKPQLAARPALRGPIVGSEHVARRHLLSGIASYYWQGQQTASGEPFDKRAMTAAHPTLPFGTKVRVMCAETGREVVVRINDRGPFKPGRIIDLSEGAADVIGMRGRGLTAVQLQVLR